MKFKYIGEDGCFCIELIAFNILPKGNYLKKGQVIDVPDKLTRVINSLDVNGLFVRVNESKKVVKKEDK